MRQNSMAKRANIIGTGLIGGSIGLGLAECGWQVSGIDTDTNRLEQAQQLGAIHATGIHSEADITFVATTVSEIPFAVQSALRQTSGWVTDAGSVKSPVLASINSKDIQATSSHTPAARAADSVSPDTSAPTASSPADSCLPGTPAPGSLAAPPSAVSRFVGGHPMAGSEQEGIHGARANMFQGSVWVLTPTEDTSDGAYLAVRSAITELGAETVTLSPDIHDELVALISHIPHLTAATLMLMAAERAEQHRQLQRLAAGGFRDMTRIAAGHPGIWPDICMQNKEAICDGLDKLAGILTDLKDAVASGDRETLLGHLSQARSARLNLPGTVSPQQELSEFRVIIPDRPGEVAKLTALASELQVNIYDLEIAHSAEGERGVLVMLISALDVERLQTRLEESDYRVSFTAVVS